MKTISTIEDLQKEDNLSRLKDLAKQWGVKNETDFANYLCSIEEQLETLKGEVYILKIPKLLLILKRVTNRALVNRFTEKFISDLNPTKHWHTYNKPLSLVFGLIDTKIARNQKEWHKLMYVKFLGEF